MTRVYSQLTTRGESTQSSTTWAWIETTGLLVETYSLMLRCAALRREFFVSPARPTVIRQSSVNVKYTCQYLLVHGCSVSDLIEIAKQRRHYLILTRKALPKNVAYHEDISHGLTITLIKMSFEKGIRFFSYCHNYNYMLRKIFVSFKQENLFVNIALKVTNELYY